MAKFEENQKTVADAGEALRKAQLEVSNLVPLAEDRDRLTALLNSVSEALGNLSDGFVEDDRKDSETEAGVRPGFERTTPADRTVKTRR